MRPRPARLRLPELRLDKLCPLQRLARSQLRLHFAALR
jgi:hypothetical protein